MLHLLKVESPHKLFVIFQEICLLPPVYLFIRFLKIYISMDSWIIILYPGL